MWEFRETIPRGEGSSPAFANRRCVVLLEYRGSPTPPGSFPALQCLWPAALLLLWHNIITCLCQITVKLLQTCSMLPKEALQLPPVHAGQSRTIPTKFGRGLFDPSRCSAAHKLLVGVLMGFRLLVLMFKALNRVGHTPLLIFRDLSSCLGRSEGKG